MGKGSGNCDDRGALSVGQTMNYLFDDSLHSPGGAVLDLFMENEMEAYLEDELDRRDCAVRKLSIPPFTVKDFKRGNDTFVFETGSHQLHIEWTGRGKERRYHLGDHTFIDENGKLFDILAPSYMDSALEYNGPLCLLYGTTFTSLQTLRSAIEKLSDDPVSYKLSMIEYTATRSHRAFGTYTIRMAKMSHGWRIIGRIAERSVKLNDNDQFPTRAAAVEALNDWLDREELLDDSDQ